MSVTRSAAGVGEDPRGARDGAAGEVGGGLRLAREGGVEVAVLPEGIILRVWLVVDWETRGERS